MCFIFEVQLYIQFFELYKINLANYLENYHKTKLKIRIRVKSFHIMAKQGFSEKCNNGSHLDCKDCMCNCHIPGTMAQPCKERGNIGKKDTRSWRISLVFLNFFRERLFSIRDWFLDRALMLYCRHLNAMPLDKCLVS